MYPPSIFCIVFELYYLCRVHGLLSGTRPKSFSDAFKKYLERVPVKTPSSTFGTPREMLKNSLVPKKVYLLIIHF